MSVIRKAVDAEKNLTTFTIAGKTGGDEILAALMEYYASQPTRLMLWDFSQADVSAVVPGDLEGLLKNAFKFKEVRRGGRTAVVASQDIAYGMGRILDSLVEISGYPVEYHVFRKVDDAMQWLMQGDQQAQP